MNFAFRKVSYACALTAWVCAGCADLDADESAIEQREDALTNVLTVDFSTSPLGPLGSPWGVTSSGSGTATIVDSAGHGRALRVAHAAERDYTFSRLALSGATDQLEFSFQVKPSSKASVFTLTVVGAKTGYKTPKFSLSLSPNSNLLTVTSVGANGGCGALPYGKWSSVTWKLRPDSPGSTRRVVDVWVNGVLASTCTGVSTSLRVGNELIISDNYQPSANAETLFDDFVARAGP